MPRARTDKTDVTEELVASLEQAVAILDGALAPGRVHHVDRADARPPHHRDPADPAVEEASRAQRRFIRD